MKNILSMLKLLLLLGLVIALPLNILLNHHEIIEQFENFDDVVNFLNQYHWQSVLIYIGIQALQVVISVIPGQAFQFAAGYLYTFVPGLFLSLIGAALGTGCSFYLAKILGQDAVHMLLGEEKTIYYLKRLNRKRAYGIVFLIYFIPGIPKDIVSYVAGISEMKFKPFLIFSLIGRIPGMAGSLSIGALYMHEHYIWMGIIGGLAVITFVLCLIYRKKLNGYIDRFYDMIVKEEEIVK